MVQIRWNACVAVFGLPVRLLAASALSVLLLATPARADVSQPSQVTLIPPRAAGAFVEGDFYTKFKGAVSFQVNGVTPGATVKIIALGAGDAVVLDPLAQGVARKTSLKLTSVPLSGLPEGTIQLAAVQTIGADSSPNLEFLTMVVDRTPPTAPPAPDLAMESDTGNSDSDNTTGVTLLKFTGTAEPNARVQLLMAGKAIKNATGVADAGGGYSITLAKAKAGAFDYAVNQTDRAGNLSPASAAVRITVLTKAPKPPTALDLLASDQAPGIRAKATGNLRPTITGRGDPGSLIRLKVAGSEVGMAIADAGGFWAITSNTDLNYGAVQFTATQTDLVGKESGPSKLFIVNVLLDNSATPPGEGSAVFADSFNDGSLDPMWKKFEPNSDIVEVDESNNRLELHVKRQNGAQAAAGYFSNGWAIDLTHDFMITVNWRTSASRFASGEAALALGLILDGSTTTGAIYDGVLQVVGSNSGGSFQGFRSRFHSTDADQSLSPRPATLGTFFMWYVAADDRLRMSTIGFTDPNAKVVFGLRSAAGTNAAAIFLGASSQGNVPDISGPNDYFDNFQVKQGMILNQRLPSEGGADVAVQSDNFDDNTLGAIWQAFSQNGDFAKVREQNKRLEIALNNNPGTVDGSAGIFSKNWSIDLTHDFRLRVDRRFPVGTTASGDVGLTFALVLDGSTSSGAVREGLILYNGADSSGPYSTFSVRRAGAVVDSGRDTRSDALGTIYLRFEAASNRLYYSAKGYNDLNARFVAGVRTSNLTKAIVFLGGFSSGPGPAPGVIAGASYYDNFSVDRGTILNTGISSTANTRASDLTGPASIPGLPTPPPAPDPDLTGDGIVDSQDVATLMIHWGERGFHLRVDLNQDGFVGADDLTVVLNSFGHIRIRVH